MMRDWRRDNIAPHSHAVLIFASRPAIAFMTSSKLGTSPMIISRKPAKSRLMEAVWPPQTPQHSGCWHQSALIAVIPSRPPRSVAPLPFSS